MNLWVLQIDIAKMAYVECEGTALRVIVGVYTSERAARAAEMEWLADNSELSPEEISFSILHIMSDTPLWEKKPNV